MYIKRAIEEDIKTHLFRGKAIVIYGARQVGKTTMVRKILADSAVSAKYINCDEADQRRPFLEAETSTALKQILGDSKIVVIDEAQRITNIGLKLKLIVDTFPDRQIIATGSSVFELSAEIPEPMTGRVFEFWLYPFSISEMKNVWSDLEFKRQLESLLIYGSYPDVIESSSLEDKKTAINVIVNNYLYKDILKFQNLKNSDIVRKLLEALALQVGNEVSYTELGKLLEIHRETVASYIGILEQAFIVFRLRPFSRNLRKELGKLQKIYFYDLGIRNSLINNHNPLTLRNDTGALWENFVIAEKKKQDNFIGNPKSYYFWRTWDQQEIDLVEEKEGRLYGWEMKWSKEQKKAPKAWREGYLNSTWEVITHDNFLSHF